MEGGKYTVWAELCLCFDEDFLMDEISEIMGVQPYAAKRQAETRINPITKQRNPGYWEYHTASQLISDSDSVLQQLHDFILSHKSELLLIQRKYASCDIYIRIWAAVADVDDFTGVRLTPQFLELVNDLKATIDIGVESI